MEDIYKELRGKVIEVYTLDGGTVLMDSFENLTLQGFEPIRVLEAIEFDMHYKGYYYRIKN